MAASEIKIISEIIKSLWRVQEADRFFFKGYFKSFYGQTTGM